MGVIPILHLYDGNKRLTMVPFRHTTYPDSTTFANFTKQKCFGDTTSSQQSVQMSRQVPPFQAVVPHSSNILNEEGKQDFFHTAFTCITFNRGQLHGNALDFVGVGVLLKSTCLACSPQTEVSGSWHRPGKGTLV